MKKKLIIIFSIILIMSCYMFSKKDNDDVFYALDNKTGNNMLSMMLEMTAGSGEYQEATASEWPKEGYLFNKELSKCEHGSILSWDENKKTVIMNGNVSDKCYVYFDVYVPTINEVCSNGDTMSNCIKKLYTKQGENNLYYHNNSLPNGAGDNSYRYAGSSDTTNNFVCFGYDSMDGSCPTDFLYRIIGVFGNQVKLIKYDYALKELLGTNGDYSLTYAQSNYQGINKGYNDKEFIGSFFWNNKTIVNIWGESDLNNINLNVNYLNNIGEKWASKISISNWITGGNSWDNIGKVPIQNMYNNELKNPTRNLIVNSKVGLMYVSDYTYASSITEWINTADIYNAKVNNWMYMGLYEWTITPRTDNNFAFGINCEGPVGFCPVTHDTLAVRPVFYLNSDVTYKSGSGTISSPILIS